jgi:UDP-N-acetylmuramate dehydrogenase
LLLHNHSLKNYNTFGVDVKSKLFAEVKSENDLLKIISDKNLKEEKKIILGGGSNILFTKNFDGLILKISIAGIKIIEEDENNSLIEAGAGVVWDDLVSFCVQRNYGGIENLTLIPGTVGAAPIQNIGAYGHELADTFVSLNGIFLENLEQKTFNKDQCGFSYRSSVFKEKLKNNFIVSSIRLLLSKKAKPNISYKSLQEYISKNSIKNPTLKDISEAVASIRRSKLPEPKLIGNAGSFFKNPVLINDEFNKIKSKYPDVVNFPSDGEKTKISAGWLIEECGWKGKRVGDVGTYPDHALVICNFGNASGAEILEFAMQIKEDVQDKFKITLQEEVNIL